MATLQLRSSDTVLDGTPVLDVEPIDGAEVAKEGDIMVVTFVDPTDGREKVAAVMVMDPEGESPWWENDGHCCEDCALGKAKDCDGGSCGVADSAAVSNPSAYSKSRYTTAPRYGVFSGNSRQ